jgi:hypothetical protein
LNVFNFEEAWIQMDLRLVEYVVYLGASVALTVWVGRTLHGNGRRFLVEVMEDQALADSVNHLLLVGFYLVNIGVAALLVNTTGFMQTAADLVRTVVTQLGIVLLVLGGMHFANLFVLQRLRHSSQVRAYARWYYAKGAGRSRPKAGAAG